jgi:PadR family transcriptional regulator, regulatory protein AphA
MQPTAVTWAILGLLAQRPMSGYDLKRTVDRTIRHFWAASYGQIYPELKRLEDQGLIAGRSEPTGERQRRVYELTEGGRAALEGWLTSDVELVDELRDEGMLKLFFSDALPEQRIENIRAMRLSTERKLEQLNQLRSHAQEMRTGPALTLDLGITSCQSFIKWCEATEHRLTETETEKE